MVQLYRRKSAEFVADTVTVGDQLAPKVVALADGGLAVSWFTNSLVHATAKRGRCPPSRRHRR